MREVKFRFWHIPEKEMIPNEKINKNHAYRYLLNEANEREYIIPMQYTGLKDKNGVEIYEGDIILHKGANGVVIYDNTIAMFMIHFDLLRSIYSFDSIDGKIEVIGNIHSNPELLK